MLDFPTLAKKATISFFNSLKLVFVIVYFLIYIKISRLGTSTWSSLTELLNGTALRPYIYRVFLPQLAKLLANVAPIPISSQFIQQTPLRDTFLALEGNIFPHVALWILVLIFLSIIGFLYVEKRFLADLGFSQQTQDILPFILLILALPFTVHFGYLYDIPQLFLFTSSLWLLYKKKWRWYLALFILTTLNKETSAFLTVVFMYYYFKKLGKKTFYQVFFLQTFIYIAIRFSIIWIYRSNSGDIIYPAFFEHVEQYQKEPILLLFTTVLFTSVFFLSYKSWQNKNAFLKSSTIVPLLTLFLYFVGGMPMEFRVFLESLPILGMLIFDPEKLH